MIDIHLGIDDTDSNEGMCTTYLTTLILEELMKKNIIMTDYPNLIRLNPNIPWKTRGNASLCLRFKSDKPKIIFKIAKKILVENSESKKQKANSGIIMLQSKKIPDEIIKFAEKCLYQEIKMTELNKIISHNNIEYFGQGTKRGLIGALAAIGNTLSSDHTYELIAYRKNIKVERGVSLESLIKIDKSKIYSTFNNIDYNNFRILITPHGKDPIFFAMRGNNPIDLYNAMSKLEIYDQAERFIIYRSNQGTSEHLQNKLDLKNIKTYQSGYVNGTISKKPNVIRGGHIFLKIESNNNHINCAIYAPTITLKTISRKLEKGDEVEIGGGISKKSKEYDQVLNAEYIKINKLTKKVININPKCKMCKKVMKSIGYNKVYKCIKCGVRSNIIKKRQITREIKKWLYLPVPSAQRHLTKPIERYGKENYKIKNIPKGTWFRIF